MCVPAEQLAAPLGGLAVYRLGSEIGRTLAEITWRATGDRRRDLSVISGDDFWVHQEHGVRDIRGVPPEVVRKVVPLVARRPTGLDGSSKEIERIEGESFLSCRI